MIAWLLLSTVVQAGIARREVSADGDVEMAMTDQQEQHQDALDQRIWVVADPEDESLLQTDFDEYCGSDTCWGKAASLEMLFKADGSGCCCACKNGAGAGASPGRAVSPPQGRVASPPQGRVASPPQGRVASPPQGVAAPPPQQAAPAPRASGGSMATKFLQARIIREVTEGGRDLVGCKKLKAKGGQNLGVWKCPQVQGQLQGIAAGPYIVKASKQKVAGNIKPLVPMVSQNEGWAVKHLPGWPLALYSTPEGEITVMREAGGESADNYDRSGKAALARFSTEDLYKIAQKMREFCDVMCGGTPSHGSTSCHKDTNPGNIYYDAATKTVQFIDLDGVNTNMSPQPFSAGCSSKGGSDIEVFLAWLKLYNKQIPKADAEKIIDAGTCRGLAQSKPSAPGTCGGKVASMISR